MRNYPEKSFTSYDPELCLHPVWKGDLVWQESVTFGETDDGSLPSARLLYTPTRVLDVRSFDFSVKYEEGRDYVIDGNVIRLTASSRITPLLKACYTETEGHVTAGWPTVHEGIYWLPSGYETIMSHTVYISYEANGTWTGPLPADESSRLPRFFDKLEKGEDVTVVWYGDSQIYGADASGTNGFAPFYEPFAKQVTDALQAKYPQAKLHYVNTAVGGTRSDWGIENVDERVSAHHPDLVLIKFGSNEVWRPAEEYKAMTKTILDRIAAACPDAEIALLSPFAHNEECTVYSTEAVTEYEEKHRELQRERAQHIAVLSVYPSSRHVVREKGYLSFTTNMINHVNDFGCRINGQLILQALGYYGK